MPHPHSLRCRRLPVCCPIYRTASRVLSPHFARRRGEAEQGAAIISRRARDLTVRDAFRGWRRNRDAETHRHWRRQVATLGWNIGKHWPTGMRVAANSLDSVVVGWRAGWVKGIRDEMFDIGGPYREDARCFRAEAISSCAVVLTLTAAETRLTERSSVWRRRGTVTYHLENRGGGTATSPFNYFFLCFIIAACWCLESGVQRLIGLLSLSSFSFCVFDLLLLGRCLI